jgi:hypothetical protein
MRTDHEAEGRHQVVGRGSGDGGEAVKVSGYHQDPFGIAKDEGQPKELKPQEEHEDAAVDEGGPHQGEGDGKGHLVGPGPRHPGGLLQGGVHVLDGAGHVQVDVGHVGEPAITAMAGRV